MEGLTCLRIGSKVWILARKLMYLKGSKKMCQFWYTSSCTSLSGRKIVLSSHYTYISQVTIRLKRKTAISCAYLSQWSILQVLTFT
jgi:hypothetical protein